MAVIRMRRSVYALPAGDQTLHWYAEGVKRMKARLIGDPLSWRYQAACHEYKRTTDPFANPGDKLPSSSEQLKFWNGCQHGIAFFLPWHRLYLALFERIVGAEIVNAGGPPDWGLPYFDYSEPLATNPNARQLPPEFRVTTSSLYVAQRRASANAGKSFATALEVSTAALSATPLMTPPGSATNGFGGMTGSAIHSGASPGQLELVPHGSMHNAIGGTKAPAGWMSSFDTAALDPIFWLHHANIDRLWEAWRRANPGAANPTDAAWLNQKFHFHDDKGLPVALTPAQTLDIVNDLGYDYVPKLAMAAGAGVPPTAPPAARGAVRQPASAPPSPAVAAHMSSPTPPLLARVSGTAITLSNRQSTVALPTVQTHGVAAQAAVAGRRSFLHLENVTAERSGEAYEVYLNVPDGEDPRNHEELCAGLLPMFGVSEASKSTGHQAGAGVTVTLNATHVFAALGLPPDGGNQPLRVLFVPHRDADDSSELSAGVRIGRISLYVE